LDECFAEDYVNHELSKPPVQGVGEYKKWAVEVRNAWTKGFPDYFIAIDDLIAEGDKVANAGLCVGLTKASSWAFPRQESKSR
jgi:predicted ester cyclase